ncbi:MAG: hypothetical protein HYX34_02035 [Actinobacteria bacterium]|nr:hypothetical protein [Actinomycetota bacterium]
MNPLVLVSLASGCELACGRCRRNGPHPHRSLPLIVAESALAGAARLGYQRAVIAGVSLAERTDVERARRRARAENLAVLVVGGAPPGAAVEHAWDPMTRVHPIPGAVGARFAEVVPVLDVAADGTVAPFSVQIAPRLHLGSLHEAPLEDLARRWSRDRADDLRLVLARAIAPHGAAPHGAGPRAGRWLADLVAASHAVEAPPSRRAGGAASSERFDIERPKDRWQGVTRARRATK